MGHHHIQNHQPDVLGKGLVQGLLPVIGRQGLVPLFFQQKGNGPHYFPVVVRYQNPLVCHTKTLLLPAF